ncbi:hypothetical protein SELMODRAFT_415218 [Selaginella moellendorffii]|uniref:Uncharacterized protein n=1 Tax=Selaginella moellendorffii TaxID=88036 RepID=D8RVE3_SELML|nr:hypothetical protein SELMODRAFT_415218 [Selaginella moellendorffii]
MGELVQGLEEACRQIAGTETDDCRTFAVVPVGDLLRQKVANGVTQEVTGQLHSAAEDKEEGPIELYVDEFESEDEDESEDKDESEDEDERLELFGVIPCGPDQVCKVGSCKFVIKNGDIMEWFVDGVNDAIVYPVGALQKGCQIIATQGPKYFIDWETEAATYLGLTYRTNPPSGPWVAATDLLAFTDYDGYVSCWSTRLPFSYTSEGIPTYDPSHCGQKKCPLKSAEK